MPTYIYRDTVNGEEFEYKQSMNDKPLEFWPEDVPGYNPNSPRPVARKIGGGTGFILKGSGWYKTDYASPSATSDNTTNATSTKSNTEDKGSAAKTESKANEKVD